MSNLCKVTSSACETRIFLVFVFHWETWITFTFYCFICLLFLNFCTSSMRIWYKDHSVKKKISCALQNCKSFCVNLTLTILEEDGELFCCFTWGNVRAEERGKMRTWDSWNRITGLGNGLKWVGKRQETLKLFVEETTIHREELGSK